jgi:DNA primase
VLRAQRADESLEPGVREAFQAFRLGYAPASWDGLTQFFAQQGVSPVVATKVGLIAPRKNGSGHYLFRNRLLFAILDVRGRVIGFSGRVLPDPETGITDKQSPKYINSPESPIYQKGQTLFGLYQARQAIRQEEEAILVEGNFDVVSLHARGVSHVVAPLGTAFTPAQARLLRRYAPVVTLLFDGDAAGKKATREARETCRDGALVAKVAVLPNAKDPDDFVREKGAEALRSTVRAAQGILRHLIDEALDDRFRHVDAHEQAAPSRVVALINEERIDGTTDDGDLRRPHRAAAGHRLIRPAQIDGGAHAGHEPGRKPRALRSNPPRRARGGWSGARPAFAERVRDVAFLRRRKPRRSDPFGPIQ